MTEPDCWVTAAEIDATALIEGASTPADGAVLLFLGVVRDNNDGRPVAQLEYEAYTEMAEAELRRIRDESRERFDTGNIKIVHRIGQLEVGEVSVAIAVGSPHRAEAYEASRYIIEELKKRVPIWKREGYVEGERVWLKGGA